MSTYITKRAKEDTAEVKQFFDELKELFPNCSDDALLNSAAQLAASWSIERAMPSDCSSELLSINEKLSSICRAVEEHQ